MSCVSAHEERLSSPGCSCLPLPEAFHIPLLPPHAAICSKIRDWKTGIYGGLRPYPIDIVSSN